MDANKGFVVHVPEHRWTIHQFQEYMQWVEDHNLRDKMIWYRPGGIDGQKEPVIFVFQDSMDAVAFRLAHSL